MLIRVIVALVVVSVALPAIAKRNVLDARAPDEPHRKFCRPPTPRDTVPGGQICHTLAEWKAINDANRSAREGATSDKKIEDVVGM